MLTTTIVPVCLCVLVNFFAILYFGDAVCQVPGVSVCALAWVLGGWLAWDYEV